MGNKPTEKQLDLLNYISNIVNYWKGTNDINSPTLHGDIEEEIFTLKTELTEEEEYKRVKNMNDLLTFVKKQK